MSARQERADVITAGLARRICQLNLPVYVALWNPTWDIVERPSAEYLEGERRYIAGELEEDALGRLGTAVINAWREAGREARAAWEKRQSEEEAT